VISQMPYRLPDNLKQEVGDELENLIESGIIERCDSVGITFSTSC